MAEPRLGQAGIAFDQAVLADDECLEEPANQRGQADQPRCLLTVRAGPRHSKGLNLILEATKRLQRIAEGEFQVVGKVVEERHHRLRKRIETRQDGGPARPGTPKPTEFRAGTARRHVAASSQSPSPTAVAAPGVEGSRTHRPAPLSRTGTAAKHAIAAPSSTSPAS